MLKVSEYDNPSKDVQIGDDDCYITIGVNGLVETFSDGDYGTSIQSCQKSDVIKLIGELQKLVDHWIGEE